MRAASLPEKQAQPKTPADDVQGLPWPCMPENPLALFRERIEQAGGSFEVADDEGWEAGIDWPLPPANAVHVFSECEALPSRGLGLRVPVGFAAQAAFRNDALRELAGLELCVLEGLFGVVENGAVWHVPTNPAVRAAALLAEHLVIVVDARSLVPSLHQAYDQIRLEHDPFGWFLCGPSKTADIEQALVFGAHGPKTMRLILRSSLDER
jgi:hypothetical protein